MALVQSLITNDKYGVKCPYAMTPKGICVHNTANDASAKNEITYLKSNNNEVSYHIAIDDIEAIQVIPFNRNAWHSGDGGNGEGNRNYIAIEICYSKSGGDKFINAEKRAAKEIASLLKQFGWGIDKVKKHQDFSNKYCPHRTLDMGWQRFLDMITAELNGTSTTTNTSSTILYRVKKSNGEQLGAFNVLDNAKTMASKNQAIVYDANGKVIVSYVPTKKYLNLKPHVASWRVYPTNVAPVVANSCGSLAPKTYGGLSYEILGNPQADVYTIQTSSFGKVNIYAPRDNDSTITTSPTY